MKKRVLAVLSVCAVIALSGCSAKELDDKYGSLTESELESVIEKEFGENQSSDDKKPDTDTTSSEDVSSEDEAGENIIPLIEKSEDLDFSYFEIGENKFNIKFDMVDTLTYGSVVGAVEGEDALDGWSEGIPFTGNAYSTELDTDGKGKKTDTSSLVYIMKGNEIQINFYKKPEGGYPETLPYEIAGIASKADTAGDTDVIFADGVKVGMKISDAEALITGNEYYGDNIRAYKDRNDISLIMHISDEDTIDEIYLIRYTMNDGKEEQ